MDISNEGVVRRTHLFLLACILFLLGCRESPAPPSESSPERPAATPATQKNKDDKKMPPLPPDMQAKLKQAQAYQKIATAIDAKISASVTIDDLSVAYSGKTATLSGYAKDDASRRKAEQVALAFDEVESVNNGIVVR